jgi:Ca2+/H+ antiporter, TMEM165/GDT1 family
MKEHPCRRFRFLIPFFVVAFIGLFTSIVYALWNNVLIDVLPVKAITFWQAMGLLILAKILFGGFPCRGRRWGAYGRRHAIEHWESLSPEEREKMRAEMRKRFGDWPRPGSCCDDDDEKASESPKS